MIKKLLLISIILLSSLITNGQMNGDARYSLGVRGYNYLQLPKLMDEPGGNRFISSKFSSYFIKFNDNLFSYRLNGSYFNQSLTLNNDCDNCGVFQGKNKDYSFKMGFEKNLVYGSIQPYFAFDLGYRSNEYNGIQAVENQPNLNIDARKRGFTISPVFGIKLSPIRELSIFAESSLDLFYAWGKTTSGEQIEPELRTLTRFKKGEFLYNPVSIGIQVHLGHKK